MNTFELYYRNFGRLPQSHHRYTILKSTVEEVFETLETAYLDKSTDHSMIEPIVNWNFGNTFKYQNGPNQSQHIHKNTSKQYKTRSYQRPRTLSITYLKEDCLGYMQT